MGKVTGFLEFERHDRKYAPVEERIKHWHEFVLPLPEKEIRDQAARCMDCGVPYCQGTSRITGAPTGCPVNNQIPDWNDLTYRGHWDEAARNLHSTNNFPEFTGRVCPAPCEASCTLNIDDNPVTIKTIECEIADRAIAQGLKPVVPAHKTGKKVAVIGSGPAGLACAQQLARAGHAVHVYERWAKAGGLLRYGIPDFKMEKIHVDRRVEQMTAEGVEFHYGADVGVNLAVEKLVKEHDAVVLAGGAEKPRDLPVPGRELKGIHFAMEFLPQQNRRVSNEPQGNAKPILATGKKVVVIGGGDTGSDCIGTSIRQGAVSVTNFEIMPQPPEHENKMLVWPDWPLKLRISSSHQEGVEREFAVLTQKFSGEDGRVKKLHCVHVGRQVPAGGGQRVRDRGRSGAARHGLRASGARGHAQGARRRARSARQCEGRHRRLCHFNQEDFRRRRHAPRPVAGGVGDPRGPAGRARGRQIPDGFDDAAALAMSNAALARLRDRRGRARDVAGQQRARLAFHPVFDVRLGARGLRGLGRTSALGLLGQLGGSGRFGARHRLGGRRRGRFRCRGRRRGRRGPSAAGAAALPSLPTGQAKSSARPGGAGTGSPLTNTRLAVASTCTGCALPPPSSSSEFPGVTVSGTTGPATGRTVDFVSGAGPTGPTGRAIGPRLLM